MHTMQTTTTKVVAPPHVVGTELLCTYHERLWDILTLQGFTTMWVKNNVALMRLN